MTRQNSSIQVQRSGARLSGDRILTIVAITLSLALLLTCVGVWLWGVVEGYINPKHATDRKDVVQAFTLVVTGIVGSISTIVGLVGLYFSRQNLKLNQEVLLKDQQDTIKTLELETRRASMSSCSRILSESPTSSDCKCELQVENKEETRYIETR